MGMQIGCCKLANDMFPFLVVSMLRFSSMNALWNPTLLVGDFSYILNGSVKKVFAVI